MVNAPNETWSADLIDMREFSNDNKGYNYLLIIIDIFSKYAWSIPLKTKTASEVRKILWVDQDSEFYNKTFNKLLKWKNIEIYNTVNEGKAVVV